MALYCLCDAEMIEKGPAISSTSIPASVTMSVLNKAMPCIKTGAEQYLTEIDRQTLQQTRRRHFPNVDIYECPKCGTRIAKES